MGTAAVLVLLAKSAVTRSVRGKTRSRGAEGLSDDCDNKMPPTSLTAPPPPPPPPAPREAAALIDPQQAKGWRITSWLAALPSVLSCMAWIVCWSCAVGPVRAEIRQQQFLAT